MKYKNPLELIGNTPIVKFKNSINDCNILIKLEYLNPTGSIKIRIVKEMIVDALNNNLINETTPLIEATSGNTGIAIALIASALNIKSYIVMPENTSLEKQKIIKLYGGNVILTKKEDGILGSIKKAKELKEQLHGFMLNQFVNKINYLTHYETTADEIISQTNKDIDYVIVGIGSGGTITGISHKLKDTPIKIIGVRPMTINDDIPGLSYNQDFKTLDLTYVDEIIRVSEKDALKYSIKTIREEGISIGISTGALIKACNIIAQREKYKKILIISPDGIERYLTEITI